MTISEPRRALGILVALLLLPSLARANVGRPTFGGQYTGEPLGLIDIAITREELAIDLVRIPDRGNARVSATYELDHRGEPRPLDLVFVAGTSMIGLEITLDGAPVQTRMTDVPLPASWKPPASTPLPGGGELDFSPELPDRSAAAFQLVMPAGNHRLKITYAAPALLHHAGQPMLLHQFAYVLAPARTWASFGNLAITIEVPAGWVAATSPPLTREGDTLKGTFTGVPAETLGITIHAPAGRYALRKGLGLAGFALALLGGGFVLWRLMRARGRRRGEASLLGGDTLVAFGYALVWAGAIGLAGWFAIFGAAAAIPADQVDHRGYGDEVAMLGVVLLALVAILVGTFLGRHAAKRGVAAATGFTSS